MPSKFRKGDFLKLAPHGIGDIQQGFSVIMAEYDLKEIALLSRSGKIHLSKNLFYSLEEDASDYNLDKLIHAAKMVFSEKHFHPLHQLLTGQAIETQPGHLMSWLEQWLSQYSPNLNNSQKSALALPFQYKTSMIQGPPGTGKTYLSAWILIALIMQAHAAKTPIRIGVSALTHQAIDTVLQKVVMIVNQYFHGIFPGTCVKWGQNNEPKKNNTNENN